MGKKSLILVSLFLWSVHLRANNEEVIIHVDDAYRPYSYVENGAAKGLYIDIIGAVFKKIDGYDVRFMPVPWERGKRIMENGQGFALAPVFFHGHDWPYLYPYSLPFYEETVMVFCNDLKKVKVGATWPEDFAGLAIGNIRGFDGWGGESFHQMVSNKKVSYHEVDSPDALILMAAAGRNDCILMEAFAFEYHFQKLTRTGQYKPEKHLNLYKTAIVGVDPVYIGYSEPALKSGRNPDHFAFRKAFDSMLYTMKKNGEVQRLISNYKDR